MSATVKLIMDGDSQVVLLPDEFRFEGDEVRVTKVGDKVILEPVDKASPSKDRQPVKAGGPRTPIRHSSCRMISPYRWKSEAVNTWPLSEMISMSAAPPSM